MPQGNENAGMDQTDSNHTFLEGQGMSFFGQSTNLFIGGEDDTSLRTSVIAVLCRKDLMMEYDIVELGSLIT